MGHDIVKTWTFTKEALNFIETIRSEQAPGTHLYIDVEHGGQRQAQLIIRFEQLKNLNPQVHYEHELSPELRCFGPLSALPYLINLDIGFKNDLTSGELEINAPNLYGDIPEDLSLLETIQYFFNQEVLPYLKQHKGNAFLQAITPDGDLILKFEGGCQGCSMATVTLKQGIEAKIKERFPQIRRIVDATDHAQGSQPYA